MLGEVEITRRLTEIFSGDTGNPEMIRAAKYYLTLGERLLILPNGKRYFDKSGPSRQNPFTLTPGETALVSTRERITMPRDLAGILGPTFELSHLGIFFFGGMLVDPGFGLRRQGDSWAADAEPLSFYLANVSDTPIQLRPGKDSIASIAFFHVSEPATSPAEVNLRFDASIARTRKTRDEIFLDSTDPPSVLGQVRDITEIRNSLDKLKESVTQIVLFGVILLGTTLVAVLSSLVIDKRPDAPTLAPISWLDATKTVGVLVFEIAVLVAVFYGSVQGVAKLRGLRKRRSLLRR